VKIATGAPIANDSVKHALPFLKTISSSSTWTQRVRFQLFFFISGEPKSAGVATGTFLLRRVSEVWNVSIVLFLSCKKTLAVSHPCNRSYRRLLGILQCINPDCNSFGLGYTMRAKDSNVVTNIALSGFCQLTSNDRETIRPFRRMIQP
jgi:hypothetical protein